MTRLEAQITAQWAPLADQLRAIPADELPAARARWEPVAFAAGSPDDRRRGRFALAAIDAMQSEGVDPLETLAAIHRARADAALNAGWIAITNEMIG